MRRIRRFGKRLSELLVAQTDAGILPSGDSAFLSARSV